MGFPHIIGSAKHYAIPHRFNLILDKQNEATATRVYQSFQCAKPSLSGGVANVTSSSYKNIVSYIFATLGNDPTDDDSDVSPCRLHVLRVRPVNIVHRSVVWPENIWNKVAIFLSWCSWTIFALLYCTIHDIMIWSFVLKFRCHTQLEGGRRNNAERGLQMDFQRMWVNRKIWARRICEFSCEKAESECAE